jgi:hypothetical protein
MDTPRRSLIHGGCGKGWLPANKVALDHGPHDRGVARGDLGEEPRITSGWRSGLFAELSCEQSTRIDLMRPAGLELLLGPRDVRGRVVGARGAAPQDDVAVRVARGHDRRGGAVEVDAEEGLRLDAARMALIAVWTDPSVPFLKPDRHRQPRGHLAVGLRLGVRAPMADQQTRSAMYCGVIGSRSSVAVGSPRSRTSRRNPGRSAGPPRCRSSRRGAGP